MRRTWISLSLAVALAAGGAALKAQGQGDDRGNSPGKCTVTVDRSQAPGVFDVTRQEIAGDGCVCYIYTGPASQPESVEGQIGSIVNSKSCPNAKVMSVSAPEGVQNSGFFGGPAAPLLALGGIGASSIAAANADENSPVVPISP